MVYNTSILTLHVIHVGRPSQGLSEIPRQPGDLSEVSKIPRTSTPGHIILIYFSHVLTTAPTTYVITLDLTPDTWAYNFDYFSHVLTTALSFGCHVSNLRVILTDLCTYNRY